MRGTSYLSIERLKSFFLQHSFFPILWVSGWILYCYECTPVRFPLFGATNRVSKYQVMLFIEMKNENENEEREIMLSRFQC